MWMFPNAMVSDGSESLNESLSSFLAILMRRVVDFDIEKFDPANDYAQLEEISLWMLIPQT